MPLVCAASPRVNGSLQVAHGAGNWSTRFRGVAPAYLDVKRWTVVEGAPFSDGQVADVANVCLLGRTVRERIFGAQAAVGETVRANHLPCLVVGVLGAKGQTAMGFDRTTSSSCPTPSRRRS